MDWKLPLNKPVTHVLFDHDGTLSIIRAGWERIMQPVMVNAILGEANDFETVRLVTEDVDKLINETTGIQTITQMELLRERVISWGFTKTENVRTAKEYKEQYNTKLMEHISSIRTGLQDGSLDPINYEIGAATAFIRMLHRKGVKTSIFSGTDEKDVLEEVHMMAYAGYFPYDAVHGSRGLTSFEVKREVLKKLLIEEDPSSVVVIGDGPVEIKEAKAHGCTAIGICNSEVPQRWSSVKEKRLTDAGADLLILDFSDLANLQQLLCL